MVFGDHDNRFKTLNTQIRNHVESLTRSVGRQMWEAAEGWDLDVPSQRADAMGATASSSGKTLRQVGIQEEACCLTISHVVLALDNLRP